MSNIRPDEISSILKDQISGFNTAASLEEVGTVLQVGDGIARIYGLLGVQYGELVEFSNGVRAVALNLEEDNVGAVLMGSSGEIKEGDKVKTIRFGQQGVSGSPAKEGESKADKARRKSFKARHASNIAKGKMSAAYWADKVKW